MSDATNLPDVAAERFGGTIVACSDDFFGSAFRLLHEAEPVRRPGTFDEHGQWMDGWESRRHRAPDTDWVVVRLGAPAIVRAVVISTAHFSGNHPERAWVDGCSFPGNPTPDEVVAAEWFPLVPPTGLAADSEHVFPVDLPQRVTHVRLVMDPDGGIARLRMHGEVLLDPRGLDDGLGLDLAAARSGGVVEECSDMHFGERNNLNAPGEARTMLEGWETRRGRGPQRSEWSLVRLATEALVSKVVVDTRRFRGNAPLSCRIELSTDRRTFHDALGEVRLQPDQAHELRLPEPVAARWLRLVVLPDGGVSRLHVYGRPTRSGRRHLALRWLAALPEPEAEAVLLRCCGSRAWAAAMVAARPWPDPLGFAEQAWAGVAAADRLGAILAHPRIGERTSSGTQESREQAGTRGAGPEVLAALAAGNRRYEERFGFPFLVRASGRSADELLAVLQERLTHDAAVELDVAAAQQAEITALRLGLLLDGPT